ncbi:MAG: hypothetical protein HZB76_07505, partial [Chlamydiae bacterium]|nr:hypothetical protein [Chlamydiota bacterium]
VKSEVKKDYSLPLGEPTSKKETPSFKEEIRQKMNLDIQAEAKESTADKNSNKELTRVTIRSSYDENQKRLKDKKLNRDIHRVDIKENNPSPPIRDSIREMKQKDVLDVKKHKGKRSSTQLKKETLSSYEDNQKLLKNEKLRKKIEQIDLPKKESTQPIRDSIREMKKTDMNKIKKHKGKKTLTQFAKEEPLKTEVQRNISIPTDVSIPEKKTTSSSNKLIRQKMNQDSLFSENLNKNRKRRVIHNEKTEAPDTKLPKALIKKDKRKLSPAQAAIRSSYESQKKLLNDGKANKKIKQTDLSKQESLHYLRSSIREMKQKDALDVKKHKRNRTLVQLKNEPVKSEVKKDYSLPLDEPTSKKETPSFKEEIRQKMSLDIQAEAKEATTENNEEESIRAKIRSSFENERKFLKIEE